MRVTAMNPMRAVKCLVVVVLVAVVFAVPTVVLADGRVALGGGQQHYPHIGCLGQLRETNGLSPCGGGSFSARWGPAAMRSDLPVRNTRHAGIAVSRVASTNLVTLYRSEVLPNPDKDVRDISAAQRRLGFEMTTAFEAELGGADRGVASVHKPERGAAISLGFYAGHSIEMDGVSYLVPVDAHDAPASGEEEGRPE